MDLALNVNPGQTGSVIRIPPPLPLTRFLRFLILKRLRRGGGGIFSKQHQILKKIRAFGADFDPIYTVIIPLNDVFGVVARRRRNF